MKKEEQISKELAMKLLDFGMRSENIEQAIRSLKIEGYIKKSALEEARDLRHNYIAKYRPNLSSTQNMELEEIFDLYEEEIEGE